MRAFRGGTHAGEHCAKKICFVVMGYGEKTDFRTQRVLNLDKTYNGIIKPAAQAAGLECIRADDVIHSGVIDGPMYEMLLRADVVVADVSTANENAVYELGVRHALRPHTTIVMAESGFRFPFDISHVRIRTYKHLGEGIDFEEAIARRNELQAAIEELLANPKCDSPIFAFLPELARQGHGGDHGSPLPDYDPGRDLPAASVVREQALAARARGDWFAAKALWEGVRSLLGDDPFVVQQLALATYKSKQPDAERALEEAGEILRRLHPNETVDAETLGLWGSIHKRLYELRQDPVLLDEALRAYGRGYELRHDHYNGINYALLLDMRAVRTLSRSQEIPDRAHAITDWILAERVRHDIIPQCEAALHNGLADDQGQPDRIETFWRRATLIEAYAGTGQEAKAAELKTKALSDAPEGWMCGTLEEQLDKLDKLDKLRRRSPLDFITAS